MLRELLRSLYRSRCRAFHHLPWRRHHHPVVAEELSHLAVQGRLQEAIAALRRADLAGIPVSPETYLRLVRSCIKSRAFAEGREIHRRIAESGIESDLVLQNNIMMLYSKCGRAELAREVFDHMAERNLFSWTAMIGAYSNSDDPARAFDFYKEMISAGIRADQFLYPLVLKSCAGVKDVRKGGRVHAGVIRAGFEWDLVVMNSLIDMYMKCECVEDAEKVFDGIMARDVFTWTAMIAGYVQSGHGLEALSLFKEMMCSEIRPQSATIAGILPTFSDMGSLKLVKQVHALIVGSGFGFDRFVGSALIDAYSNCRGLGYGQLVFDRVRGRDAACWNVVIKGYAQVGLFHDAIGLLTRMSLDGVEPNDSTWDCIIFHCLETGSVSDIVDLIKRLEVTDVRPEFLTIPMLLRICEHLDDIEQVKELHEYMKRAGYVSNSAIASSLVGLYTKFGDLVAAQEIFDSVNKKELGLWNLMISCYAENGHANKAVELFDLMQMVGMKPDVISWNAVIAGSVRSENFESALEMFTEMNWSNQKPNMTSFDIILPLIGSLTCPLQGKQFHNIFLRNGCEMSGVVKTAFINMYCNCWNVCYAVKLFESMACKDIVSWNAIISGLAKNGFLDEASKIFSDMNNQSIKSNIITWTSLISGYVHNGEVDEALKLFRLLHYDGLKPNAVTIASILPACAQSATVSHGKAIHGYIIRTGVGYDDLFVGNALVDMFIKCGYLDYAEHVFQRLPRRDVVSWNTMIQGYVIHGNAVDGLYLFEQMMNNGIAPDSITLVGVLSACGRAGLVDEGWKQFNYLDSKYGIAATGKHYACMVDILGRGGRFDDIRNFIIQMPLQPTATLWANLLLSCKARGNVEMGEYAAYQLLELQPENPWNYVILSDVYASAGRWNDASRMRKLMVDRGAKEQPEYSWIEVKNHVYAFTVENLSHSEDAEIPIRMLQPLVNAMVVEGSCIQVKNPDMLL